MPNHVTLRRSLTALSVVALGACATTAAAQTMAAVAPGGKLSSCPADSVVAIGQK
jgi:hypothetical protein